MSSTFGTAFRITTFGESHGPAIGAIVDGCPPRIPLTNADIQRQLDRRRPGQSALTSQRREKDVAQVLSGISNGLTMGTPIAITVLNTDCRSTDYAEIAEAPRPSHADYTYRIKYGISGASGGGRASARETLARVAAGAVAEQFLAKTHGIEIVAWVSAAGSVIAPEQDHFALTREQVDYSATRCPDAATAGKMTNLIRTAASENDSVGGVITCICRNVPPGWGEPVFDKLSAVFAHAMLSIPAAKGFDIGSGFDGTNLRGSENNDLFVMKGDRLGTATNRSGGIQGGISNGEPIVFRVAFKPVPTIGAEQSSSDYSGKIRALKTKGRHDPCVLPRAVPIVEAMAALVLADAALLDIRERPFLSPGASSDSPS